MYSKYLYEKYEGEKLAPVMEFGKEYIDFLSHSKTERLCVRNAVKLAELNGFKELSTFDTLKAGDKVYVTNRKKNLLMFVIGKEKVSAGLNVLGAHIDSPRLDAKQNPIYESKGFALLDTHYYGGIKKYQYVTRPLALYGVVCKKDGTVVDVNIGDNEGDPIVGISDLLIHLSGDQLQKTAAKVIEGENLDLTLGSLPLKGAEGDKIKANVLNILKEKYDIEEDDFVSAEIEIVPQGPAKDYGLDRSMIAGYGHDDRVCAYTSLRAILEVSNPVRTSCCILVDKEEVGSIGSTGAQSRFFENIVAEVLAKTGEGTDLAFRRCLTNSFVLSSDVTAALDPLFLQVMEERNAAVFNKGIAINKYTGARGKSGCNDAHPEFIAHLRKIFDEGDVNFQTGELGKVDQGGGGTIAYIMGNLDMTVIDAGVPVLNMHSPMEIVSKLDTYEAYRAYKVFLLNA